MSQWRLPGAADNRPSFFAHALALSAAHGPGPWPDAGYPLPDEESVSMVSGSVLDGVRTHHFGFRPDKAAVQQARTMILDLAEVTPDLQALHRLHDFLAGIDTLTIADGFDRNPPDQYRERLRQIGRWLAEYGTRRDAVAAGLVLIGVAGDERDRDLLLLLGSIEELTLYAVVALERTQSDRDMAIFELARRVRAWGRIHAVERLHRTTDPEIKAWLLRDGFRNEVMNEYLAHIAATTGDLAGALLESEVDDELLDGASEILDALCDIGGPAKDMTHYAEAPVAIDRYLRVVRDRPSVQRIRAVLRLDRYLGDDRCRELLTDLDWIAAVQQAVDGPDLAAFTRAIWPARRLQLPIHDQVKAWLEREPYDTYLWASLDDADETVSLAERLLPLAELRTGPAVDDGVGVEYGADWALEAVINQIGDRPGRGWSLVRTALANRLIRNRNTAVRALRAWPRDKLPPDAAKVLGHAVDVEPDQDVRAEMTALFQEWQPAA